MADETSSGDDRRRAERLELELPLKGRVGDGDHLELELVDISKGGMQIRCGDFDVIKTGFQPGSNVARFEIHITARLAWAQPGDDGVFLTGWEFEGVDDEELVG